MSEERIKERCKREDIALKIVKGFLEKDCYEDTELEYSLNTLLDLYNKQKEEIERLKNAEEYSKLGKETLLDTIHKQEKEVEEEKEKWKELFHEYNKLVGEVIDKEQDLKDSISKDTIRDKIKELDDLNSKFSQRVINSKERYFTEMIQNILKELLEE